MKFQAIEKLSQGSKDVLVIYSFKSGLPKGLTSLSALQNQKIQEIWKNNEFKGGVGEIFLAPKSFLGKQVLVLAGLGEEKEFNLNVYQQAAGEAVKFLQAKKFLDFTLAFPAGAFDALGADKFVRQAVIAAHKASYKFSEYLNEDGAKLSPLKNIYLGCLASVDFKNANKQIREGEILGKSINFTRELGNLPPIHMTPKYLAAKAIELGKKYPAVKVRVMGESEIVEQGMGGLHAVSLGSEHEPQFIIMEYFNDPENKDVYVWAGKGITFDSGGISIKPADKMDEMKFDMLGAGAVIGAMRALAELKLKINVVGLIPATENMSGHKAYRPGDIVRARNGKTIEILNTDAEGRVILADALSFAQDYKPKFVIDLATLTGACVVALGEQYAGLFTRDESFASLFKSISDTTGEKIWRLPLDDNFKNMMKSKVADVKNISETRYGGASSGAGFLEHFTDYPWAHLDIAGVAWSGDQPHLYTGATGYGVQLLIELAKTLAR